MKQLLLSVAFSSFMITASAQAKDKQSQEDPAKKTMIVDASCGQCQFALAGEDCDLAVRIKDSAYYVDGTAIDDHGDAHATDGFCNTIRKAKVQGEVVNGRFVATYFRLLPMKSTTKASKSSGR
ncbi:MAG TPA: DUF6370 family protein [Flavisolibacter sp.]|jgi:hypothetical protein